MGMGDTAPVYGACFYVSECVIGATYNKQLAYEMGKTVGNEGLVGNERGDGLPYSGWYAPAVNIHRSPFSGRNWEYYSEDSVLSGKLAAEVVKGAAQKGVYTFIKHFALNDLETNRDSNGILVWANEQTMREIYLKPFETAVKDGGATGMMSSFNRIGKVWAGGDYRLLTEVLRGEWGFKGTVITDYAINDYLNIDQMLRAGGDLCLNQSKVPKAPENATQVTALRNASKNILYTVVNSNAMNAQISGYRLPVWTVALIVVDVIILTGFLIWGVFAVLGSYKKLKAAKAKESESEPKNPSARGTD
jgi:beta-glucosidase